MASREIRVRRLISEAILPSYAQVGDSGLDLCAIEKAVLPAGKRCVVRTGIALEIPEGMEAQVRSRSGLARDYGIVVLNSPGTIDSGYRGEILVLLANFGDHDFEILSEMRIAQLVFCKIEQVALRETPEIEPTQRGTEGLGSTGGYPRHSRRSQDKD